MNVLKGKGYSRLAALLAGAAMCGLVAQNAMAVSTSGTNISNTATLSYAVGGVSQTSITSAAAQFVVDKKVDLTVTRNDATPVSVVPGQIGAVTKFTVTNLGNDPQGMTLAAAVATGNPVAGSAAPFDVNNIVATGLTIYLDSNANGVYDAGVDTAATSIPTLAATNGSQVVFVLSSIPIAAVDTNQSVIALTATAVVPTTLAALTQTAGADSPLVVDTVFADGAGATDAARDGKHSVYDAYKVVSAILSVTKTVTPICDPVKGNVNPMNIPGAAVQYAITISNTGTAAATLATVSDTLAATLLFDTKLISGIGVATPATTCANATGASLAASGFGTVTGAGTGPGYTAPGLAAHAVTAGGTVAGQVITINYATLQVGGAGTVLTTGALPAGNFITVYFNAFVQ